MGSAPADLPDSMRTLPFREDDPPAAAPGTALVRPPTVAPDESPVVGDDDVPLSVTDLFTPRELAAWRGLLEVHAHVHRQLDVQMRTRHGLTLSQSEVLILLDDAPDQRMRMAELAKEVLLSSSGGTRVVERLKTLGYVTRLAATDDRRGLYAQLTDAGRHVVKAARATYQEGVRATFLDQLRAADQVALSVIWTQVGAGQFELPANGAHQPDSSQMPHRPTRGPVRPTDTTKG